MKRGGGVRARKAAARCVMLGLAFGPAQDALAAPIAVTTEEDAVAADGVCSLREAITAANDDNPSVTGPGECAAGSGADTVFLGPGSFTLSRSGAPDDTNDRGDLDILGTELTIAGAGAGATTIDAKGIDRAIDVRVGRIAALQGLTITGGRAPNGADGPDRTAAPGAGITGGDGDPGAPGGGIRNLGTLTVLESTISGNVAGAGGSGGDGRGGDAANVAGVGAGGTGGSGGEGGGIFNSGVLTVTRSAVRGNTAGAGGVGGFGQGGQAVGSNGLGGLGTGGSGGDGGSGGGIAVANGAIATIRESSISGNTAGAGGDGMVGQGGAGGIANGGATGGQGGQGGGGPGGDGGSGGGIVGFGSATATGVLLEDNAAGAGGDGGNGNGSVGGPALGTGNGGNGGSGGGNEGGGGGVGGGILVISGSIVDSTVGANLTGHGGDGGNGTGGQGGGALSGTGGNGGPGTAGAGGEAGVGAGLVAVGASTIRHATIVSNPLAGSGVGGTGAGGPAGQPGGQVGSSGGPGAVGFVGSGGAIFGLDTTTLTNSIVAGNGLPSCGGTVQDGGHNIVFPDLNCPGAGADPKLGELADHGGPTETYAIGPGSPALDAVPSSGAACSPTDQRGVSRPFGASCDAGAYEWAPPGVATGDATVTSSSAAVLHGAVNPNARATTYHFELGTSTAYGRSTPEQSAGAGTAAVAVEAGMDGLAVGVTYHYRLVATNADGTTAGEDRTLVIGDTEAPRFLSASVRPRTFAVNRRGRAETPVAGRTRRGTRFRYRLSEPARVLFAISRARPGRRVGRRCVKPTRRNRTRRKCTRFVRVGRFAMQARAGSNAKRFSGKIGRRSLKPGTYRATLTAKDAAGNVSAPRRLRFRVVRAR